MRPIRAEGLLVETVGDEVLVFDDAAQRAAALNRAAAAVFELCDGTRDVDALVGDLAGGDPPLTRDAVVLALSELAEQGLVTDVPDLDGVDRRSLLAKLGVGAMAALAIPVVETLGVPTPAMAQSMTSLPTSVPTSLPTAMPTNLPTGRPTPRPTTFLPTVA